MMSQGQQAVAELVAGHELSLKPARELDRAGDFSTVPSPRSHQGRLRWSHSAKRRVHRKKKQKKGRASDCSVTGMDPWMRLCVDPREMSGTEPAVIDLGDGFSHESRSGYLE